MPGNTKLFIAALAIAAIILAAPHYLTYSDSPRKAEAVIVLVGPGFEARMKGARFLIQKGMADVILIPAHSKMIWKNQAHHLSSMQGQTPWAAKTHSRQSFWARSFYQDTYLEILKAKGLMDEYGIKSAIAVSSPYHMRRVKIMCENIFDKQEYRISCFGTPYETTHKWQWLTSPNDRRWVLSEWAKIACFLGSSVVKSLIP